MKPLIEAVVGVLADGHGQVLVAQRPAGKVAAGKWEFPGGKIEPGESPRAALWREMNEELAVDVDVESCERLVQLVNEFDDRRVRLDVWLVRRWQGTAHGAERQLLRWLPPEDVPGLDFLPGGEIILPRLADALAATPG